MRGEAVRGCENPTVVDDDTAAEKTERVEKTDVPRS